MKRDDSHQKNLVVRPSLVFFLGLLGLGLGCLLLVAHSMGGSRLTLVDFSFRKLRRSENVISVQRR